MQRIVTLGHGKTVTLAAYVRGIRLCKASPPKTTFKQGLCGWWPEPRETILREFMEGVHDRINQHVAGYGQGRKWVYEWQIETYRASRQLNHPRLVIDWLPLWLKPRFAHRLRVNMIGGILARYF